MADDTVASAFNSVQAHCTNIVFGKDIVWSFDLMVLRVFPDRIEQLPGRRFGLRLEPARPVADERHVRAQVQHQWRRGSLRPD